MDAYLQPLQQRFGRPVHVSAAHLSADGAVTQCLRQADGACYPFDAFGAGAPDTPYPLDLKEQADIYGALLAAVNDRTWLNGFSTFGYNPTATLRDKSLSVRGKPAETILFLWFRKL